MVMDKGRRRGAIPAVAWIAGASGLVLPAIALIARLSAGSLPATPLPAFLMLMSFLGSSLILAFLGGIWWGVALGRVDVARLGRYFGLAILPTILALGIAAMSGWMPKTGAVLLGVAIIASLLVDRGLRDRELVPSWWLPLRAWLSIGLGLLTILLALLM